jgi:hypothetical protein
MMQTYNPGTDRVFYTPLLAPPVHLGLPDDREWDRYYKLRTESIPDQVRLLESYERAMRKQTLPNDKQSVVQEVRARLIQTLAAEENKSEQEIITALDFTATRVKETYMHLRVKYDILYDWQEYTRLYGEFEALSARKWILTPSASAEKQALDACIARVANCAYVERMKWTPKDYTELLWAYHNQ